ncbi:MAG TPA: TfoX/Sxy family protein [Burkholderiales bacterium]|nr:TfoX/Sxy family protein [Burkholderiales bacterium]
MNEFAEYLHEVFSWFGPISVRRMFGGYGLFREGLMFGLVSDDTLYLKADEENAGRFEKLGLGQFGYRRRDRLVTLSYYMAPAEILEDSEQAAIWARSAFEAACRSRRTKR